MRNIALGALLAGLLAACGGKSNSNPDVIVLTTPDAANLTCNPSSQTGCNTGEKCTWVRVSVTASDTIGQLGCVADGTKALNTACTWGAAGASTGYDDCAHGLICLGSSSTDKATGTCVAICDTAAAAGATGACATNYACGLYNHYFENKGDTTPTTTGVCDPTCDPLTQKRDDGGGMDAGANCGGGIDNTTQPPSPNLACNGQPSQDANETHFTCSSNLHPTYGFDHVAWDAALGGYYLNSCAPGFIPLLYDNTADALLKDKMKVICVAFCVPAATNLQSHPNPNGVPQRDCVTEGGTTNHECRYWWFLEGQTTPLGKYSNSLGYCFNYTKYMYASKSGGQPDTGDPSCTTLDKTKFTFDPTNKKVSDDMAWGCVPQPTALTGARVVSPVKPVLKPLLTPEQMEHLAKSMN